MNMKFKSLEIIDTTDILLIKDALDDILYVPNNSLKPKIIKELTEYLELKFSQNNYKIKTFIALNQEGFCGFVTCQIEPEYKSRGYECGSFGWLNAKTYEVCKKLMTACEIFMKQNEINLFRGNINFPKDLGGMGILTYGFNEQMLYGIPFNSPDSKILHYLKQLGYKVDAEYLCAKILSHTWKKGKHLDNSFKIKHYTLKEMRNRKEDILSLARNSFRNVMPDSTTGGHRFDEIMEIYSRVPNSFYKLNDTITWAHFIVLKDTDEIIASLLSLPDLYQFYLNKSITRANVDTVMVKQEFSNKGILSSLIKINRFISGLNGVDYFEGTTIWTKNKDAIKKIIPHCEINRKFVVVQKVINF